MSWAGTGMTRRVSIAAPGSMVELRRVLVDHLAPGESRNRAVEVVAAADLDEVRLAASAPGWIAVSTDDGMTFWPLGTDVRSGLDIGPMAAGERRQLSLKIHAPEEFRQRRIVLLIGEGT